MRFHLPNEGVEGLESASFFYVHGFFFFLHIWFIASTKL